MYFQRDNLSPAKVEQPNIVKIKEHNFTAVYPIPYPSITDAKHIISLRSYFKLKNEVLFLCFTNLKC